MVRSRVRRRERDLRARRCRGNGHRRGSRVAIVRLAYVTPSCQFPLGLAMSLDTPAPVAPNGRAIRSAWIVEDDYDCDIHYRSQPLPCLHALDPDGRVIYVGTFSKALFPALRLGFLIVPRDLQSGFNTARLATDLHPPVLDQMVLAAFISRGHYARHVRRMQAAYAERLEALLQGNRALGRTAAPAPRSVGHACRRGRHRRESGTAACRGRRLMGVESMPLSAYYFGDSQPAQRIVVRFWFGDAGGHSRGSFRSLPAPSTLPCFDSGSALR